MTVSVFLCTPYGCKKIHRGLCSWRVVIARADRSVMVFLQKPWITVHSCQKLTDNKIIYVHSIHSCLLTKYKRINSFDLPKFS